MDLLYDVPPFNMASGPEFLAFYFFISLVGLLAAVLAQITWGASIDRRAIPEESSAPGPGARPYRAGAGPTRRRLTAGWVPRPDELWAVAYLKEGTRGVANALISAALAAGWIAPDPAQNGQVFLSVTEAPTEPARPDVADVAA